MESVPLMVEIDSFSKVQALLFYLDLLQQYLLLLVFLGA